MIRSSNSRLWNPLFLALAVIFGSPRVYLANAQDTSSFLEHLLTTQELTEAGATQLSNIQWSPDGTKLLLWRQRGVPRIEYLENTAVVDARSGKFVAYVSEKSMQKVVANHPKLDSGSRILLPEATEFRSFTIGNSGLLCTTESRGLDRIANWDFRLQRQTALRSDRVQPIKIIARRGANAVIECKADKPYPWELYLYSIRDEKLMPMMQDYRGPMSNRHNFYLPANSSAVLASFVRESNSFSFLPRSLAQGNVRIDAGVNLINAAFCNQDQWLCCLTSTDSKSYRLEFYDVKTGKRMQQIFTPADQVSNNWRSLQSSIDGTILFVAEDKLLLEWNGEHFEKLADVTTQGIREIFAGKSAAACSMDPTGKQIAVRLRGNGDNSDDFWLLATEAFRAAKRNLEAAKKLAQQQANERRLSERPVAEIAFDQKKLYHPEGILLRWVPTGQQRNAAEKITFSSNNRWIIAQFEYRTHLYDLWNDKEYNLNQLAWDQYRIGSVYSGKVRVPASRHFSISPRSNRLLMTGSQHAWIWDLQNISPSLIQHASVDRRAESEWEEALANDLDNADHIRLLKPLPGAESAERILVSTGRRIALIGMRENEFFDLDRVPVSHRIFSLSNDDEQLVVLNSNVTTSTESELRVYSLSPKLEGKSLQALPQPIEALSSPYSGAFLIDGYEDVDDLVAAKQDAPPTDYHALGFEAKALFHQPNSSEWIAVDRDPPRDSVRIYRLGIDFSLSGTMTLPRLEDRYIKSIAQTSDARHIAISYSHDNSVWLLKSNWE